MFFTKIIIAAQIEFIWCRIRFLRKKRILSEKAKAKIDNYKANADRLGLAYEILAGLR